MIEAVKIASNAKSETSKGEALYKTISKHKSDSMPKSVIGLIIVIITAAIAIIGVMVYVAHRGQMYDDLIKKGDDYFAAQEYKKAIPSYNEAIKIDKDKLKPYENKARIYLTEEKYNKAGRALNQISEKNQTVNTQMLYVDIAEKQGKNNPIK